MTASGLGSLTLAAALAASVAAAAAAALSIGGGSPRRRGGRALSVAAVLLVSAVALLAAALLRGDWSLTYVADYTSRDTPWPYRLAALWGGMEGSLLLWTAFFALWSVAAVRWCRRRLPEVTAIVQGVLAGSLAVLTGLLVWASPPFASLEVPAIDGGGLTPVLRHPAMLYHPLLLYLGQVSLAVPFAIALAATARGVPARAWLPGARRWMLGSLVLLGVAMVAGAHWAYVELGWGGYWAWDPVENAALLPWLAGLAFCHAAVRAPGPDGTARGPARFAVLAFGLALWGAFLTRSGATGSVHAFADAASVGAVFLAGLGAAVAGWLVVDVRNRRPSAAFGPRRPSVPTQPTHPLSRERALAVNGGLLLGLVFVVAVGTLVPLLWRAVADGRLVITGRYFASVTWPFALALLALAGVGPRLRGHGSGAGATVGRLVPALVGVPCAAAAWWWLEGATPLAVTAAGLGGAAAALTVVEWRDRSWRLADAGGLVSHLGLAVLLVGVTATATGVQREGVLGADQEMSIRGYTLRLERLVAIDASGPGAAVEGSVAVRRGGERVATLRPVAMLTGSGQRVSVAGLRSTPLEDLLVTLRSVGPDGDGAVVEVSVVPLAVWVWWGGLLLCAGMALGLTAGARRATEAGQAVGGRSMDPRQAHRRHPEQLARGHPSTGAKVANSSSTNPI